MKILIATDGSDYSKTAIEECCRLIIRSETSDILIVSAFEDTYPIAAEPFAISAEFYQKVTDGLSELAEGFVHEGEQIVRDRFPDAKLAISTEVLHGAPDHQIVHKAKEWDADLIVVGSHGRGFWGRMLGSVSDGVVHHAPCSVLVVRKPIIT